MGDLLDNECGNGSAQLAAGLHDAKTKRYYFSGEQEIGHIAVIDLHKGTDNTKRGQA
jgi:hypothetical protein